MQILLNKYKKLLQILDMKIKLTEQVLPFYHFSVNIYAINNVSDREQENTPKPY